MKNTIVFWVFHLAAINLSHSLELFVDEGSTGSCIASFQGTNCSAFLDCVADMFVSGPQFVCNGTRVYEGLVTSCSESWKICNISDEYAVQGLDCFSDRSSERLKPLCDAGSSLNISCPFSTWFAWFVEDSCPKLMSYLTQAWENGDPQIFCMSPVFEQTVAEYAGPMWASCRLSNAAMEVLSCFYNSAKSSITVCTSDLLLAQHLSTEGQVDNAVPSEQSSCSRPGKLSNVFWNFTDNSLGIATDISCSGPNQALKMQQLPTTMHDRFFQGLAIEPVTERLYWSTWREIVAGNLDAQAQTILMNGWIKVSVAGFNLGENRNDIAQILIKGVNCGSIEFTSSNQIACSSGNPIVTSWNGQDDDVEVITLSGGSGSRVSLVAEVRIKEGMKSPFITKIAVAVSTFNPQALAVSSKLGKVFFSDSIQNYIAYCDSGTGDNPMVLIENVGSVQGMEVDDASGFLYLTDVARRLVSRVQLALNSKIQEEILLSNLKEPRGIALDPALNNMFLTNSESEILVAHMDGTMINKESSSGQSYFRKIYQGSSDSRLRGIAVVHTPLSAALPLPSERKLYWLESGGSSLYWSSYYGTQVKSFLSASENDSSLLWPQQIVLDSYHHQLYFTEFLGKLRRCSLQNCSVLETLVDVSFPTKTFLTFESSKYREQGIFNHFFFSAN